MDQIGRIAQEGMAAATDRRTYAQAGSVGRQLHPPRATLVEVPGLEVCAVQITNTVLMADA